MSDFNFADLAQVKAADVKPPVLLPEGRYTCTFSGPMKQHKAKSGNVAMRFPFKVAAAEGDVDQGELEAAGGIPDKEFSYDFWMSPDARYRFTDFACKSQGLSDELNLIELAEGLISDGKPFSLQAKHEPNEDPDKPPYLRWDNPTAAE
jgi:hypothetical protein